MNVELRLTLGVAEAEEVVLSVAVEHTQGEGDVEALTLAEEVAAMGGDGVGSGEALDVELALLQAETEREVEVVKERWEDGDTAAVAEAVLEAQAAAD